jgi:hypothetical protein
MMQIIGATRLDKNGYVNAVKDSVGIRRCDSSGIELSDDHYVLASMTKSCSIFDAYKLGYTDLVTITFISDLEDMDLINLVSKSNIRVHQVPGYVLLTDTLTNWINSTIRLLTLRQSLLLGHYLWNLLTKAGYTDCFSEYEKIPLDDQPTLFYLRRKRAC